jgi:hypothetical protein
MIHKRLFSPSEKSLFLFSAIGICTLLGLGFFNVSRTAVPDVEIPPPVKRPNPNGFDLYIAAANALVRANPPVDQVNDPKRQTPDAAKTLHSLSRKQAWLKTNAKAFTLFRQAMKTPSMHPDQRDISKKVHLGHFIELGRTKIIEANVFKLEGRPEKAIESGLDCIQMGIDISQNSDVIGMLVASSTQSSGVSVVDDPLIHQLTAKEANIATRCVESLIARNPTFIEAVEEDRWEYITAYLDSMRQGNEWRSYYYDKPSLKDRIGVHFLSPRAIIATINSDVDESKAFLKEPYNREKIEAIEKEFSGINQVRLKPMFCGLKFSEARRDVALKLLALRLALQAYQVEKGAYPQNLNTLSPQYLKVIPTDDFKQGQPFGYRLSGKNYVLWSVGPDGKDDNGKPIPPKKPDDKLDKPVYVNKSALGDWVAGKNS